jgi:signal transduction histidine kinase
MDELSLYVLDITMNSVRAGADEVFVELTEDSEWLTFRVRDNGSGMTEEQLKKLSDPFFTTRKTRKVGLGIPFLRMLAEMTGGHVEIRSVHESVSDDH